MASSGDANLRELVLAALGDPARQQRPAIEAFCACAGASGNVDVRRIMSFSDLSEAVNKVASWLRCLPTKPDFAIIKVREGWCLAVAELAAVIAGVPFIPIDADETPQRLAHISLHSGTTELLDDALVEKLVSGVGVNYRAADCFDQGTSDVARRAMRTEAVVPQKPAYVIFSSGSTGAPKGVVVGASHLLSYVVNFYGATLSVPLCADAQGPQERLLLLSAHSFDPSIGDIFAAILGGHVLLTASRQLLLRDLNMLLAVARPTVVVSTPAVWSLADPDRCAPGLSAASRVALGGEAPTRALCAQWSSRVRLYNVYGVTECVGYQTSCQLSLNAAGNPIPSGEVLGHPIGSGVFLLLQRIHSVPDAESRAADPQDPKQSSRSTAALFELVIVGAQTTFGYLGLEGSHTAFPQVTDWLRSRERDVFFAVPAPAGGGPTRAGNHESFVPLFDLRALSDSSSTVSLLGAEQRVHETGDIVRADVCDVGAPNGLCSLRLCGRQDFQVKISGKRVALEEVERVYCTALNGAASSDDSAVLANLVLNAVAVSFSLDRHNAGESHVATSADARLGILIQLHDASSVILGNDKSARLLVRVVDELATQLLPTGVRAALTLLSAPHPLPHRHSDAGRGVWWLEAVPRTTNGKIDRRHIAAAFASRFAESAGPLLNSSAEAEFGRWLQEMPPIAQELHQVWVSALGFPGILHTTNFFAVGGDSLTAVKLSRAVHLLLSGGAAGVLDEDIDQFGNFRRGLATPQFLADHPTLESYAAAIVEACAAPGNATRRSTAADSASRVLSQMPESHRLLMDCCCEGEAALVAVLLEAGVVSLDQWRRVGSLTPLHAAAAGGCQEVCRVLLRHGARPTTTTSNGVSPAHLAAERSRPVLELLLSHGSPPHARDRRMQSLLHFSSRVGNVSTTELLLDRFPELLLLRDKWQRTAVHWAAINNRTAVLEHIASRSQLFSDATALIDGRRQPTRADLERLARAKTHVPYESPVELAVRLHGSKSRIAILCMQIPLR